MYLKAEDLNWQNVQTVPTADMQTAALQAENRARLLERLRTSRRETNPPMPEPEPTTTERISTALRNNLATLSSQGLLTTALTAAITTFAIVLTIAIMVWLYTTRRWQKRPLFDELAEERGEEFYEEPAQGDPQTDDF